MTHEEKKNHKQTNKQQTKPTEIVTELIQITDLADKKIKTVIRTLFYAPQS